MKRCFIEVMSLLAILHISAQDVNGDSPEAASAQEKCDVLQADPQSVKELRLPYYSSLGYLFSVRTGRMVSQLWPAARGIRKGGRGILSG